MIKFVVVMFPVDAKDPNDAWLQLMEKYKLPVGLFDFSSWTGIKRSYLDAEGREDVSWIKDQISQAEREKGR